MENRKSKNLTSEKGFAYLKEIVKLHGAIGGIIAVGDKIEVMLPDPTKYLERYPGDARKALTEHMKDVNGIAESLKFGMDIPVRCEDGVHEIYSEDQFSEYVRKYDGVGVLFLKEREPFKNGNHIDILSFKVAPFFSEGFDESVLEKSAECITKDFSTLAFHQIRKTILEIKPVVFFKLSVNGENGLATLSSSVSMSSFLSPREIEKMRKGAAAHLHFYIEYTVRRKPETKKVLDKGPEHIKSLLNEDIEIVAAVTPKSIVFSEGFNEKNSVSLLVMSGMLAEKFFSKDIKEALLSGGWFVDRDMSASREENEAALDVKVIYGSSSIKDEFEAAAETNGLD